MNQSLAVVLLWHMHQPESRDLLTGRPALPWARLHGARHYLKMASLLAEVPTARATFNVVPCLVEQLDAVATGEPTPGWLELAEASDWSDTERRFLRRHFLPHHLDAAAASLPGFHGLAAKADRPDDWTTGDYRRLVALFALHWTDPEQRTAADLEWAANPGAEPPTGTVGKLHNRQADLAAAVLPAYRRLAATGRLELSTSPQYHPILPILIDAASALEAVPGLALPSEFKGAREDAARQLVAAIRTHELSFGSAPSGLWPSEGAVGPGLHELLPHSIRWLVVDEALLARCEPAPVAGRAPHHVPYRLGTAGAAGHDVAVFFRDRELSDRISFRYADMTPEAAASDFLEYAGEAAAAAAEAGGHEPAVLTVALDGENPWERFADAGAAFLRALYRGVAAVPHLVMATPTDVLARWPTAGYVPLGRLAAGSWVRGDLTTWIGHAEQNRAWDRLHRARADLVASGVPFEAALEGRPGLSAPGRSDWLAWRSMWAAEGSDWFWWLGPEHPTKEDSMFVAAFDRHLANTYLARGSTPPSTRHAYSSSSSRT